MKEEWLFRGAIVPIDAATTAALVAEIKRLIDVVGGMALAPLGWTPEDTAYRPGGLAQPEQPTIEQSLIVEQEPLLHPPKREWVGLTDEDMDCLFPHGSSAWVQETVKIIEAKLKEKNA
jgi:hypothetical protein